MWFKTDYCIDCPEARPDEVCWKVSCRVSFWYYAELNLRATERP